MNLQRREEIKRIANTLLVSNLSDLAHIILELLAHIDTLEQTAAEQVIARGAAIAPHTFGEIVNQVRDIASQYAGTEQLRERIAYALAPHFERDAGPTPDYTGEGSAWVPPVMARAVAVPRDCGSCASYQDIGGDCMKCDGCEPGEMPNWTPSRALASACAIPADSVLMEALTCISLCSRNSASSKEECGKIARTALWQSKYGPERIAWELDETASGRAYYGNALRVAKDFQGITPEERGVLDAWLTGRATFDPKQNFSWPLQEIAAKLRADLAAKDTEIASLRLSVGAVTELFLEHAVEPGSPDCRCCISPPCDDCVENAGIREAFEIVRIIAAEGVKS